MNKQYDALMITRNYLLALYFGAPSKPEECKLMADLCSLALPMKYRLSKQDIDALKLRAKGAQL